MTTLKLPNTLDAYWMPFTPNRRFKANPRLLARAEGMFYFTPNDDPVLDATAGMWCSNAGHCRQPIVEAIQRTAATLDFAPSFNLAHPAAFEFASRLTDILPDGIDHAFFCNSGSEAVDTALKAALAYHRAKGQGTRTRLIGRERAYHGVGFGGISVGGIVGNRKQFGTLLAGVDHLPHTHDLARNAFSHGQPAHGAELADALERLVALHDPSTIAAVIVEPVAGSTGVLVPPQGYLERLRAICDAHGILLIFDEVITGFGRTGAPFAAQRFGVRPDIITVAKGLTNATVPMGAVGVSSEVHDAIQNGADGLIEFAHGYTYSGHPLAVAAGLATLNLYRDEGLFERAAALAPVWEDAVQSLKSAPHVVDVRNIGLVAGIELAGRPNEAGERGQDIFHAAFDSGLLIRVTGDTIALSPPLIISEDQIGEIADRIKGLLNALQ
ncbi:MAG: aspartate aminotransferase family protein [Pseudomonadota bacterium]|uniref:aspartate aminotransferase family protein n=1 Tax=Sphingomonas sp. ERG5 TaxID=1381597 RepID=UPI00054B4AD4|nr:aspartate aminotransferase family protein [Sphingomonas sp. ERG5]